MVIFQQRNLPALRNRSVGSKQCGNLSMQSFAAYALCATNVDDPGGLFSL